MAFAKENLKPLCSPANLDLCDDEKRKAITDLQALSIEELEEKVEAKKKIMQDAQDIFEAELEKLQAKYEELEKAKEETVDAVKNSGLGHMSAVLAAKKKAAPQAAMQEEL